MNYPYPLPNGHAALQLRLPDLLMYLKTDTYLMDVNTGEHYAVYSDKIRKMSVTPKLYSPWGYRQLLHIIQSDALRFGVNSPQPSTSGVSQKASTIAGLTQPSPASRCPQPPASPCRPTIVKYEPPAFSLETPTQMLTRDERNQVLQNHIVAANAVFNKVAVFKELIQREPHNAMYYEEVQRVQKTSTSMWPSNSSTSWKQMTISGELQGYCDWTYPNIFGAYEICGLPTQGRKTSWLPSMTSTTNSSKSGGSVHFQPIDPAQKSSVQAMDQSLLNSSLNLLDDLPQLQSSSSNEPIPHGQAMPRIPAHRGNYPVPPMPYTNQTAVDQHKRAQPAPLPPRMSLGSINVQSPKQVQPPQLPDSVQPQ